MTNVVVFDLDGTLLSNDSTKIWLVRLLKANIFRWSVAILIFPFAMLLMKTKTYKVIGSSLFVWIATYGLSKTQLQHKIEHFSQAIKHKQLKDIHWFDDALVVLKQHIQDGKTVIIATAAPEILAQTLMRSIGLNICVIGTPIKKIWGGWVGYAHCRHIEKVQRLHLMGVQQPWYASYSDDLEADYPLLKHGQHAYLINSKTPHHLLPTEFKITMLQWS